jgi:hypothetical protein
MNTMIKNDPITDWDDAYANTSHITNGESYIAYWQSQAAAFREKHCNTSQTDLAYGLKERNKLDIFWPIGKPKGLVFFVHGGYWMMLDKNYFSHLAQGAIDAGYACAIPSYSLCPALDIAGILLEMTAALKYASAKITGNIHLCGHSAGGHLVTHLITRNSPLNSITTSRIVKTLSISGLHDLRPLLNTTMRETLKLNEQSAQDLSPALTAPASEQSVTCWVGEKERPEFIRQSTLLPLLWQSFDTCITSCIEKNKHHFNVIEGLTDANHPLMKALLSNS